MSVDAKLDLRPILVRAGINCDYRFEPTINQTQLVIEIPYNFKSKLPDFISSLLEKLCYFELPLTSQEETLYHELVRSVPSTDVNRSIVAKPVLDRRNVVIRIIGSPKKKRKKRLVIQHCNLAALTPSFRAKRLEDLITRIETLRRENCNTCAITGLTGTGKSELAKAYAWGLDNDPTSAKVFRWRLNPDQMDKEGDTISYQQSYLELLRNFGIPLQKVDDTETPKDREQRLNRVLWAMINEYPSWVVIFDNAGTITDIQKYLPPPQTQIKGQILVTTQCPKFFVSRLDNNLTLNQGLDHKQACSLFEEMLSGSHKTAYPSKSINALVRFLDHSPMSIKVAAAHINLMGYKYDEYRKLLNVDPEESKITSVRSDIVTQATDNQHSIVQYRAVQLLITGIREKDPLFFELLQFCSFVANDNIPGALLENLLKDAMNTPNAQHYLKELMVSNINRSILNYDDKTGMYYIHRLTQRVIHNIPSRPDQIIPKLINTLLALYSYDSYSLDKARQSRVVSQHLLSVLGKTSKCPQVGEYRAGLFLTLGQLSQRFGEYNRAHEFLNNALTELCQVKGSYFAQLCTFILGRCGQRRILDRFCPMRPHKSQYSATLMLVHHWRGYTRCWLKRYQEALADMDVALQIVMRLYGDRSFEVARVYNFRCVALQEAPGSSPEDAKKWSEEAQRICQDIIPRTREINLEMGYSNYRIAECLKDMRKYRKSLHHYRIAVRFWALHYNNKHPWIAKTLCNIAALGLKPDPEKFEDIGVTYEIAMRYLEDSLRDEIDAYGGYTSNGAIAYGLIGQMWYVKPDIVLNDKSHLTKAMENIEHQIRIWTRVFGKTYQELAGSYYWKGRILEKMSTPQDLRMATTAYKKAIKISQHHPNNPAKIVEYINKINVRLKVLGPNPAR
jgi:tetratricopeptide (TPR) repeat protein